MGVSLACPGPFPRADPGRQSVPQTAADTFATLLPGPFSLSLPTHSSHFFMFITNLSLFFLVAV